MGKHYPIGIQSFEELRKGGYYYADKTELIYRLVKTGKYYFLSRPRRFGKSLLISTLEAYFLGRKELFQGLAMEQLEKDWTAYPVLHLDLNSQKYDTPESLERILDKNLKKWEAEYEIEPQIPSLSLRFVDVIERAAKAAGRNVVVLVDEYDKPLLQTIGKPDLQDDFRATLKAFYGVLKSCDASIRFALLTGVTKFSKVSVFSDYEEAQQTLKQWYDGYHFGAECPDMYNPFSLLNTFAQMRFGSYWFDTGTPTFLVETLKHTHYDLHRLTQEQTTSDVLGGIGSMDENPIPLLYQSGYLTIKGYDKRFGLYRLGFPNEEVEKGFISFLLPYYAKVGKSESIFQISLFVRDVESGDIDSFMQRLQSFFADTPYELVRDLELHYQNVLFIVFKLLGFYTHAEYHTSKGRIDLTIQTDRYIYVMEFKLDGTAEEALRQIEEKHYAQPFLSDTRQLYKVGVNFSAQARNIEKWIVN